MWNIPISRGKEAPRPRSPENRRVKWDSGAHLLECPRSRTLMPRASEGVQWQDCLLGACRQSGAVTVEDSVPVLYKTTPAFRMSKPAFSMWSSSCTPWYLSKRIENLGLNINHHTMFVAALVVIAKTGSNQDDLQSVNGWTKWYVFTMSLLLSYETEGAITL